MVLKLDSICEFTDRVPDNVATLTQKRVGIGRHEVHSESLEAVSGRGELYWSACERKHSAYTLFCGYFSSCFTVSIGLFRSQSLVQSTTLSFNEHLTLGLAVSSVF